MNEIIMNKSDAGIFEFEYNSKNYLLEVSGNIKTDRYTIWQESDDGEVYLVNWFFGASNDLGDGILVGKHILNEIDNFAN